MAKIMPIILIAASFATGFVAVDKLDPNDPTNPRRGETEYGKRFESLARWFWVKPSTNPRLNPKSRVSGPLRRHFMRGRERWVQIWDVAIEDWRDSHIDHVYPDEAVLVPDMKYLEMKRMPNDGGRTGTGQGVGGLNPYEYDEDGVKRDAWHGEEVDPIKRPWR